MAQFENLKPLFTRNRAISPPEPFQVSTLLCLSFFTNYWSLHPVNFVLTDTRTEIPITVSIIEVFSRVSAGQCFDFQNYTVFSRACTQNNNTDLSPATCGSLDRYGLVWIFHSLETLQTGTVPWPWYVSMFGACFAVFVQPVRMLSSPFFYFSFLRFHRHCHLLFQLVVSLDRYGLVWSFHNMETLQTGTRTWAWYMGMVGACFAVFVPPTRILPGPFHATRNFRLWGSTGTGNLLFTGLVWVGLKFSLNGNRTSGYGHVAVVCEHVYRMLCSVFAMFARFIHPLSVTFFLWISPTVSCCMKQSAFVLESMSLM